MRDGCGGYPSPRLAAVSITPLSHELSGPGRPPHAHRSSAALPWPAESRLAPSAGRPLAAAAGSAAAGPALSPAPHSESLRGRSPSTGAAGLRARPGLPATPSQRRAARTGPRPL